MASVTVTLYNPNSSWFGDCWHKSGPAMACSGRVKFTRNSERDKTVYFSGTVSNRKIGDGSYGYSVTAYISVSGRKIQTIPVTNKSSSGSGTFSGSFEAESSGTVQIHFVCGQTGGCSKGTPDVVVGNFNLSRLPYNPEVPPTKISGGAVYNQNGVQNGNDKLDWEFYVNWWGESAGTHKITQYNLDLYKSTDLNTIVATVNRVSKWTRYNFEDLIPKCKVGETYYFYINMRIDNSYWIGKVLIGNIKLYKDGIVYVKRYDNGAKVEATMAYSKYYQDGSKKKVRYIYVKDYTTGAQRIIDMYTTHYE